MSGSFRNVISLCDTSASEPLSGNMLSIGIQPNGFLFALMDGRNRRYLALEEYRCNDNIGTDKMLDNLDAFWDSLPVLGQPVAKTYLSLFEPHFVIIPASVYDPEYLESYYSFCASLPSNHQLQADKLITLNAYGIYAVSNKMIELCKERLNKYVIRHQASILIDSIITEQRNAVSQASVVLQIKAGYFEILLLQMHQLLCYQSFLYTAFDDVLYYLFYFLEQYGMNANQIDLVFLGEMTTDSREFNTLKGFFRTVILPERNKQCLYSEVFEQLPAHYYHNIFNLIQCE
jgi:hypothetical protein